MTFLLPILGRIIPALAVAGLVWYGWYKVDRWCNGACRSAQQEVLQLQHEKQQAQERATALALLWAEAINRVEVRYVQLARSRGDAVAGFRERAGRIRLATGSVPVRVPGPAVGLLDDAHRFAVTNPPAPGGNQEAPAPVPLAADPPAVDTSLDAWIDTYIAAAAAYRDAADKHAACVAAYESLYSK